MSEDVVRAIVEERGKVYGDPYPSLRNIGLAWTAVIQQHYQIDLPHPIPASRVAMMMAVFKVQRSALHYKDDNYIDLKAYAGFAEQFQLKEEIEKSK